MWTLKRTDRREHNTTGVGRRVGHSHSSWTSSVLQLRCMQMFLRREGRLAPLCLHTENLTAVIQQCKRVTLQTSPVLLLDQGQFHKDRLELWFWKKPQIWWSLNPPVDHLILDWGTMISGWIEKNKSLFAPATISPLDQLIGDEQMSLKAK